MTEHWHWPQWVLIVAFASALLNEAANDGETRIGKYSFSARFLTTVVVVWILWVGGFWT